MTHPDAERWNARYLTEGRHKVGQPPAALLRRFASHLPSSGLALDAACGVGTHGLFLAFHGLRVFGFDISLTALRLAQASARAASLPFFPAVYDLSRLTLPPQHFEVILNFRFLERSLFPLFRSALKPGGLLFFETFLLHDPHLPDRAYYLLPGELFAAFSSFEIIHHKIVPSFAGRSLEQLVARKPA